MARSARRASVEYGKQGGIKGGAERMRRLGPQGRSDLARHAAKSRYSKKQNEEIAVVPPDPPYVVIRSMLDAIERTGHMHVLFVAGERTWFADDADPSNRRLIDTWRRNSENPDVDEPKPHWVGNYGPKHSTSDVMRDLLDAPK